MESSAHCRHTRTVPPLPGPCPAREGLLGTACPCRTPTDPPKPPKTQDSGFGWEEPVAAEGIEVLPSVPGPFATSEPLH